MSFYGKNVGVVPLTDAAGITKVFNWPSHKGVDIGWYAAQYCPVLAWQDGKVVDKGYGSEVGNYIVVEHTYADSKRWTGYIHLADTPSIKIGDKVTLGKQMGNARRGNTGVSNGVHLHLYLTDIVSLNTAYSWNKMLEKSINPVPFLYWSKEFNTSFISTAWKNELKKITYPQPIARNEKVHQIEIKSETRRLRQTPSLSGTPYDEYCTKGIYNIADTVEADGYTWALISQINGNEFWAAMMSGEDLPAKVVIYPTPVERDMTINQIEVKSDTRKLREKPSLQGEAYDEMCKRGIYNVLKWETADGYDWALIAVIGTDEFWVAAMAGEDLPIADYQALYAALKVKNDELMATNNDLMKQIDEISKELSQVQNDKNNLITTNNNLVKENEKLLNETKMLEEKLIDYSSRLNKIAELAKI